MTSDGGAGACEIDERLADAARSTCVDAPGRLIDHQNRGLPVELTADDEFLKIAA